jgi:hypothetical protein
MEEYTAGREYRTVFLRQGCIFTEDGNVSVQGALETFFFYITLLERC